MKKEAFSSAELQKLYQSNLREFDIQSLVVPEPDLAVVPSWQKVTPAVIAMRSEGHDAYPKVSDSAETDYHPVEQIPQVTNFDKMPLRKTLEDKVAIQTDYPKATEQLDKLQKNQNAIKFDRLLPREQPQQKNKRREFIEKIAKDREWFCKPIKIEKESQRKKVKERNLIICLQAADEISF